MIIYENVQQGSDEWLELRGGVLTGTKLTGALGGLKAQLTQIYELIGEEFAPLEQNFKSPYMDRGNELEPIAKAKYSELTGNTVKEVGFVKSETYKDDFGSWLGLSPDGLIETDGKYTKAIEIKCPGSKNFVKYSIEGVIPDEYYEQVLTYFLVIEELEELDFIIYHPDFYLKDKKLKIITITREQLKEDLEKTKDKLLKFRELWIANIKKLKS